MTPKVARLGHRPSALTASDIPDAAVSRYRRDSPVCNQLYGHELDMDGHGRNTDGHGRTQTDTDAYRRTQTDPERVRHGTGHASGSSLCEYNDTAYASDRQTEDRPLQLVLYYAMHRLDKRRRRTRTEFCRHCIKPRAHNYLLHRVREAARCPYAQVPAPTPPHPISRLFAPLSIPSPLPTQYNPNPHPDPNTQYPLTPAPPRRHTHYSCVSAPTSTRPLPCPKTFH